MDDIGLAAGGRVTRSLRNRLMSIDSDASSSRPGTPVTSKLAAITETSDDMPTKSVRLTRRNSISSAVSTPTKTTRSAALRAETPDIIGSPARRSTRKRSVSITEDEHNYATLKSSAVKVKQPQFDALLEEDDSNTLTPKRITRSQSKSPLQPSPTLGNDSLSPYRLGIRRTTQKRKPGPKSKTKKGEDANSDVEVINLETEDDDLASNAGNQNQEIIVLINDTIIENTSYQDTNNTKTKHDEEHFQVKNESISKNTVKNKSEVDALLIPNKKTPVKINILKEGIITKDQKSVVEVEKRDTENPNSEHNKSKSIAELEKTNTEMNTSKDLKNIVELKENNTSKNLKGNNSKNNTSKNNNSMEEKYSENDSFKETSASVNDPKQDSKNKTAELALENSDTRDASETQEPSPSEKKQSNNFKMPAVVITNIQTLANLSPKQMVNLKMSPHSSPNKNNNSPSKNNHPLPILKSVVFNNSANEDVVKGVYPKTPGLTKSKSYIDMDSSKETASTDHSFQSEVASFDGFKKEQVHFAEDMEIPETQDVEMHDEVKEQSSKCSADDDFHDATNDDYDCNPLIEPLVEDDVYDSNPLGENTPHKPPKLLSNVQSSTPLLGGTTKQLKKPTDAETTTTETEEKVQVEMYSPDKSLRSGKKYGESPNSSIKKSSPKLLNKSAEDKRVQSFKDKSLENQKDDAKICDAGSNKTELHNKSTKANDNKGVQNSSVASPSYAKSWTQSVSVKAGENSRDKIDTIMADERFKAEGIDEKEKEQLPEKKLQAKSKGVVSSSSSRYESEDEEEEDVDVDEGEEEEVEDAEDLQGFVVDDDGYRRKEKSYKKFSFIEDEAMEVDYDYISGDSMEEDELREIKENEVHDEGESIGSEDTDDEAYAYEDEAVEEHNNFIVSDTEEDALILEYSDDDEHLEDNDSNEDKLENADAKKQKKKSYKRIQTIPSDSDDSDVEEVHDAMKPKENDIAKDQDPLILEVSKMIDETIQDEINAMDMSVASECINLVDKEGANNSILNASNKSEKKKKKRKSSLQSFNANEILNTSGSQQNKSLNKSVTNGIDNEHIRPKPSSTKRQSSRRSDAECVESKEDNDIQNQSRSKERRKSSLNESKLNNSKAETAQETTEKEVNKVSRKSLNTSRNKDQDKDVEKTETGNKEKSHQSLLKRSNALLKEISSTDEESDNKAQKRSVSMLGDISIRSSDESDDDKQDEPKLKYSSKKNVHAAGLSVSFGQIKATKKENGKNIHSSFTIGVSVTKSPTVKPNDSDGVQNSSEPKPEPEPEPENVQENESPKNDNVTQMKFSSDEEEILKKVSSMDKIVTHMASIKSGRKSLALPMGNLNDSSDDYACNTGAKKKKRHSLFAVSTGQVDRNADEVVVYKPSQSFVDNIEERKRELNAAKSKRKRHSKSFNGGSTLDSTLPDDVHHLYKESKIVKEMDEVKMSEKEEEKEIKQKRSAVTTSHPNTSSSNDGNKMQRILGRCDEILQAANHAKLEAKINHRKSLVRLPKKSRKESKKYKATVVEAQQKEEEDEIFVPLVVIPEEVEQQKEKTKLALTKAFKTSVEILTAHGKKKNTALLKIDKDTYAAKCLPAQVIEALSETEELSSPVPKKRKKKNKESRNDDEQENLCQYSNAHASQQHKTKAGNIIVAPLTPAERKKKKLCIKKFELPTGTVSVEPSTPQKKIHKIIGGFREGSITPQPVGFKVRQIVTAGQDTPPPVLPSMRRKRKRHIEEPQRTLVKPLFTQSGPFTEEELIKDSAVARKAKKGIGGGAVQAVNANAVNFKQSALNRDDIPRETSRSLLQRKERGYSHKQF